MATTKDRLLQAYRKGDMTALRGLAQQMRASEHRASKGQSAALMPVPESVASSPAKTASPEPRQEVLRIITAAPDEQVVELQRKKEQAEIELRKVQAEAVQNEQAVALYWATVLESDAKNRAAMAETVKGLSEAVAGMQSTMRQFQSTIDELMQANANNAKRAVEVMARPKRVIRENGRIVGIEIGSKS